MYEVYTRQALPSKRYRELLGTAISVFNSNNAFVIENIIRDDEIQKSWFELIDSMSGNIEKFINPEEIRELFHEIVQKRNRIIHSFQITDKDGNQVLATKEKEKESGKQYVITEDYLMDFIEKNEKLSEMLHDYRGF